MSGGAFDYLYRKSVYDGLSREMLEEMRDALLEYAGSERAVALTSALILGLDRLDGLLRDRLSHIWYAVEWNRSCDTTEEYVVEQLAQFNAKEIERTGHEQVAEVSGWVCVRTPERDAWWMTKAEYEVRFGVKL